MQAALLPEAPEEPAPPAKRPSAALKILGIGWPVMLTTLAGQARSLLTYWLLNHMSHGDSTEMAAFSLADIWCRVTGICFISGLGGGLDTFASQAYGAKQHKKLGLQVLRTFILLTLFINIPIITVWLFAEPILIASGQDPIVASKVRMYARIAIPGQLCLCLTICLVKMLQAMGKTKKMASINLSFTAIGLVATYAAVDKPGHLGVLGAAVVNTSIQVCTAFVYILVVARDPECRQCWPGINSSALRGWCAYLKIAVPCFVMGVCEWWSWDIVTFLAGECDTVTLPTSLGLPSSPHLPLVTRGRRVQYSHWPSEDLRRQRHRRPQRNPRRPGAHAGDTRHVVLPRRRRGSGHGHSCRQRTRGR